MANQITETLTLAVLRILHPLVRILLRNGLPYHAFAEVAKKVYVDVAFDEFGVPGKKQTVSSAAVTTGLTRKEVKRLREAQFAENLEIGQRYNRAVRVISGWLHDPRFCDAEGKPCALPLDESDCSFSQLVKKFSGDMPTQAMLQALLRAGSVETRDNKVFLIRHAFIPAEDPIDKIRILGTDVAELTGTIAHNLASPPELRRFQRKVCYDHIPVDVLAECHQYAGDKAQALLETLEVWLRTHQSESSADSGKTVSIGIYYYESDTPEENPS